MTETDFFQMMRAYFWPWFCPSSCVSDPYSVREPLSLRHPIAKLPLTSPSFFPGIKYLYIGVHYWDVPLDFDPRKGLIWTYVVGAVYNPILAIVKQSILIFLLRLASINQKVRKIVWGVAIFNAALMVAVFLVVIFQCSPIAMNWDLSLHGKCIKQLEFGISTACLTILTDLIAVALPFYIFVGLKLPKKTKAALIVVFLLGLM